MLGTDLDYFESEVTRLMEQLQDFKDNSEEGDKVDQVLKMNLEANCKKSLDICSMLLKTSKKWFEENQELNMEVDQLRIENQVIMTNQELVESQVQV